MSLTKSQRAVLEQMKGGAELFKREKNRGKVETFLEAPNSPPTSVNAKTFFVLEHDGWVKCVGNKSIAGYKWKYDLTEQGRIAVFTL